MIFDWLERENNENDQSIERFAIGKKAKEEKRGRLIL